MSKGNGDWVIVSAYVFIILLAIALSCMPYIFGWWFVERMIEITQ